MDSVYYVLRSFTNPYILLMLMLGIVLFRGWRRDSTERPRWRRAFSLWCLLYLLSLPDVSAYLVDSLENRIDPVGDEARSTVDAAIVLGAGVEVLHETGDVRLTTGGMSRCLHAFERFRTNPALTLILCGGIVDRNRPGSSEAEAMRRFLNELGVPNAQMILEEDSRSTFENIQHAKAIVDENEFGSVSCITHGSHMYRAQLCLKNLGLAVIADPCRLQDTAAHMAWHARVFPDLGALDHSRAALHEWLGIAWYRLKGRV